MSKVVINNTNTIDFKDIENLPYEEQLKIINNFDMQTVDINKQKYDSSKNTIKRIIATRSPDLLKSSQITLLSLMDFFQKIYVSKTFHLTLSKIPEHIKNKIESDSINIVSKINNFPHLIGISSLRDDSGKVISRAKPQEFLDGVLYQWILLTKHTDFVLDFEKMEVFPWIHQTLRSPTYILLENAINSKETKFHADIIFIRKIHNSDKYSFHLVGLKREKDNTFAFKSQFAISKQRYHRINKMFDLTKAVYDFYKEKMPR